MTKLLFVTPFFPPSAASGSFRALGFAKHLPKFGWEVTVVASGPRPWETNDPNLSAEIPNQTEVHYVDFPLQRAGNIWHQVLQRLRIKECTDVWNPPALRACVNLVEKSKPDVVLTSGPPHNVHLLGRALQSRFNLRWVADFRDPWCSWGQEMPYVTNRYFLEYVWERSVFRFADAIIANTSNTARMFCGAFPNAANRIITIPNGFDPTTLIVEASNRTDTRRLTLLHTGQLYAGRNPRPIAVALRNISESNRLGTNIPLLRLLGRCDSTLTEMLASEHLLPWVDIADPVPYRDALAAMREADILVLIDTPGRRIGVPAKLYEYLDAQRPILAIAEQNSDTALILEKSGIPHRIVSESQLEVDLEQAILSLAQVPIVCHVQDRNSAPESLTRAYNARALATRLTAVCSGTTRDALDLETIEPGKCAPT